MIDQAAYVIAVIRLEDEDGGGYLGFVPDLPGCMSDGETRQEALANTEDALAEWLAVQIEREVEIPEPGSSAGEAAARESKLLDAIKALVEYREHADGKIADLERKLAELIAILRDNSGRIPSHFNVPKGLRAKQTKMHH